MEEYSAIMVFERYILKQRVLPTIIMFWLLPRVFYTGIFDPLVLAIFCVLVILIIGYLFIRLKFIKKYIKIKWIIIDMTCIIVGISFACIFNEFSGALFCGTIIPSFVNNYKALKKYNEHR